MQGAKQRKYRAHGVLAGSTDVKATNLKCKSNREADHDERDRAVQHVAHVRNAVCQHICHAGRRILCIQNQQQNEAKQQTNDD